MSPTTSIRPLCCVLNAGRPGLTTICARNAPGAISIVASSRPSWGPACRTHGVKTIAAPWCEPHSRFTLAFECFAIAVLSATGVQAKAARLLRLSPTQVQEVMARAVVRGLARRDHERHLPHLSLDEKSFQQGHHYISVLGDSVGKGVLDVVEGRPFEAAKSLLQTSLSLAQREQVASVSMDMWPAFAGAKEQVLPQAQTVHDRFPIAQYLVSHRAVPGGCGGQDAPG